MAEGSKKKGLWRTRSGDTESMQKGFHPATGALFPWLLCFSVAAFLVVVVAAFFQIQIISLQEELAALKCDLSREQSRPKMLRKRSSGERESAGAGQRSGVQAAHLQGSLRFQHVQKQGRIGPWSLSTTEDSFVRLRGKGTEVEVSESGLYYIYAQVYYLTSRPHNSYQILSHNGTEERKLHRNIVTCSSQGRNSPGEGSCYSGLVTSLQSGERLYLNQIEQDRIIHFKDGCSYFGIVLLQKNGVLKQKN